MSFLLHPVLLTYHADDVQTAEVDGSFGGWHSSPLYIGTNEFMTGDLVLPSDLDASGTVSFIAMVSPVTAAAAKNVQMRLEHKALTDGESLDVSAAWTPEDSGDESMDVTQDDLNIVSWTETVANLGWAADDFVVMRLSRIAAVANELSGGLRVLRFAVKIPTVQTAPVPWNFSSYIEANQRFTEENIHGAFLKLADAETLATGDDIVVSKGTGKIVLVVNAGTDTAGDVIFTGTTVNRETGAETGADTDTVTLAGVTTDTSATDAEGNVIHGLSGAYITSKWFTGSVTISTTEVDLTDVDVWHVSFEQVNDQSDLTLETFDANLLTTNANAWVYMYLYTLEVTGSTCAIASQATLSIADGDALADQYWRLRRGNINKALDGATDGLWVDVFFGPTNQTYFQDVTIKVWGSVDVEVR